jgi:hypothetical protein
MPNRPGSEEIASSMPLPLFMRGIIHEFILRGHWNRKRKKS